MALSFTSLFAHILSKQKPSTILLHKSIVHRNHHTFQVRCSTRPSTQHYQPTIWNHDFFESLKNDHSDQIKKEDGNIRTKLEEEVRMSMIESESRGPFELLETINDNERLGLGYYFEKEIDEALDRIAETLKQLINNDMIYVGEEKSLHATALIFRILRQHGHQVSQDMFMSFKDHKGGFKESLEKDVKGMLSLYEASFLAFEGEALLEEARSFTILHLKSIKHQRGRNCLANEINHALEMPLHHRTLRLEARWYIEEYSRKEYANHSLLQLAIMDFNMVQYALQNDLLDASKWWKSTGLTSNLSFIRDRLMECFFWTVGIVFEPQYSNCRQGLTKVTSLITTIDDIYDVYGTFDELQLFTYAVKRWDVEVVNDLPDYMRLCFLALYNTVNEMAYNNLKHQGTNTIPILANAWADLCEAFLVEAMWNSEKHTPTLDEYLANAWRSVSGVVILVQGYFLMEQNITEKAMEDLGRYHDLLKWSSMIFRLCNDLGTSSAELKRGESANSILCYMKEDCVTEEFAREHIRELIDQEWKKMNKYLVSVNSTFPKSFIQTTINLARISHCTYQFGDGHGAPDSRTRNRVLSLLIEPITLLDK